MVGQESVDGNAKTESQSHALQKHVSGVSEKNTGSGVATILVLLAMV